MNPVLHQSFLTMLDYTPEQFAYYLDLAAQLKKDKKEGKEAQTLKGKNFALIFEKDSTRTRCAFEVAARDQGAYTTYLGPTGSQIGKKESIADTARVLGSMFDAIEFRGFAQSAVEELSEKAGVPVWNGLTDYDHPTPMSRFRLLPLKASALRLSALPFVLFLDSALSIFCYASW